MPHRLLKQKITALWKRKRSDRVVDCRPNIKLPVLPIGTLPVPLVVEQRKSLLQALQRNTAKYKEVGDYQLGETIGTGAFSVVKSATHMWTGETVAVKKINRKVAVKLGIANRLKSEMKLITQLKHPHVIRAREIIQMAKDIFIVMEFAGGGTLFEYMQLHRNGLPEDEARRLFQQLMSGLQYCHSRNVAHRDLKAENLLLDDHNNIKIADFGLSAILEDDEMSQTSCGTPNYAAPEVIKSKSYDGRKADIWSCGVLLYILLAGYMPFNSKSLSRLYTLITTGTYMMPEHVTGPPAEIIRNVLKVDVNRRWTLEQIIAHPWFTTDLPVNLMMCKEVETTVAPVKRAKAHRSLSNPSESDYQNVKTCTIRHSMSLRSRNLSMQGSVISNLFHHSNNHRSHHTRASAHRHFRIGAPGVIPHAGWHRHGFKNVHHHLHNVYQPTKQHRSVCHTVSCPNPNKSDSKLTIASLTEPHVIWRNAYRNQLSRTDSLKVSPVIDENTTPPSCLKTELLDEETILAALSVKTDNLEDSFGADKLDKLNGEADMHPSDIISHLQSYVMTIEPMR